MQIYRSDANKKLEFALFVWNMQKDGHIRKTSSSNIKAFLNLISVPRTFKIVEKLF